MNVVSSFFGNLGKFWEKSSNTRFFRYALYLLIVQFVLILWFYNRLPPEIPLFFSQDWGQAWITSSSSIFLLPLFSFIIMLINYFLALYFFTRKILLSQLLVIFSFIFSIFSTLSVLEIIRLVI